MTASKNSSNLFPSKGNQNSDQFSREHRPFENYELQENNFEMIPENVDYIGDTGMMH